jgi:hypothetical protein
MVEKIKLENSSDKDMQLCIEPMAEYIDWGIGKFIEIELTLITDRYNDELNIAFTQHALVIYECRQYEMKVFVDKELKYHTPEGRYT